ncbi:glycerophosphoryl diester phosphodiesterase membrane domain-containing protein [Paenilisteria rocourtiae]|uniref:Glycerophosphoryl diester phosphodiesterase n=2 Tax=Listeria rocourtiae TaxID=647910 RepID=A0A4R6ZNG5_9LIST|nr:glycerophosphodiester phosphodiesterase [Listeria rocourtiae]TDR54030.1 glycerophosphoryl diester phosphodiesterase [Listeria rocourtiae]
MNTIKIWQTLRTSLFYTRFNSWYYIKFVFVLQAMILLLAFPFLALFFSFMTTSLGYDSITDQNILEFLRNPLGLLFAIIFGLLALFFIYLELSVLILITYYHQQQIPFTIQMILRKIMQQSKYLLSYQFVFFLLYFALIVPIAGMGLHSELTDGIYIPNFIVNELLKSTSGSILYFSFIAIVIYINIRLVFSLEIFLTRKCTIFQAMKRSWSITRWQTWRIVAIFIIMSLVAAGLLFIAFMIFLLPTILAEQLWSPAAPVVAGISLTLSQIFFIVAFTITPIYVAHAVNFMFLTRENKVISHKQMQVVKKKHRKSFYVIITASVLALITVNGFYLTEITYSDNTQIIAHRGLKSAGVENSLESLHGAAKIGVDFVEMDVLETKDHQFVVFHDTNLRRMAGINRNIRDMTLAELEKVTIRQDGFTSTIPSLETYIEHAKKWNINLNIEIKTHGGESKDFLANFEEIVQKHGVERDYIYQSLNRNIVETIKERYPTMRVGFIVPLNFGNLVNVNADFIVIEEFSFSASIQRQARERNMDLLVWTITTPEAARKYMLADVDGIITEIPEEAMKVQEDLRNDQAVSTKLADAIDLLTSN